MRYFALILLLALPAWAVAPEDVIKDAQQAERENQLQKAAEAYESFLKQFGDHSQVVEVHYRLAKCYDLLGKLDDMEKHLKAVTDSDKKQFRNRAESFVLLAKHYATFKKYDEAAKLLEKLLSEGTGGLYEEEALNLCAGYYAMLKKYDDAAAKFNLLKLRRDSTFAESAAQKIAILWLTAGKLDLASIPFPSLRRRTRTTPASRTCCSAPRMRTGKRRSSTPRRRFASRSSSVTRSRRRRSQPVPAGLSDVEAGSLPETFFTVWQNVFEIARLQPGETLLVQGGSSGIGVTAIQLAKAFGCSVIVTAGSDEKCAACVRLGADHAINYRALDFAAEVKRLTAGRGADVILDMVAGDYLGRELDCVAEDGRIALIAVQGGTQSAIDAGLLLRKRGALTGSTLRPRPLAYKAALARALREKVWPLIEAGRVRPAMHRVFDAAQAGAAHALMESSTHVGKIVLRWR